MLETHRRLYNACLEQRKTAYDTEKKTIRYDQQSKWYTQQRKTNPYFARTNSTSAQATLWRLQLAFDAFFRRIKSGEQAGYPRFKNPDRFNSIAFPRSGDGVHLTENRLRVQYVGVIRVKLHREVQGEIKTVTLKRELGKWFVIFSCVVPDKPLQIGGKPAAGVDVGLEHFLTTSDGAHYPNPRYLKSETPRIRIADRSLSRKKAGSKNWRKSLHKIQLIHARVRNTRRHYHHQVALKLVRAYCFIAVESLNIRGMLRNGRLSKAIMDVAWGDFLSILRHKAEKAGVHFVAVNPRGTSQQCVCGAEVRKKLSDRWHDCPECGLSLHRDHVAAKVILAKSLVRTAPAEPNVDKEVKRAPRSRQSSLAK